MSSSVIPATTPISWTAVPNGSAATPSFAFQNSSSTGIYRVAADSLGISTAGVQRVVVDASGKVGIGMGSNPYPLAVKTDTDFCIGLTATSAGTGARLLAANLAGTVYKDLTIDGSQLICSISGTERMRIDASGNLGLGVTSQITGNTNGIFLGLTSGTRRFGAGTTGSFNQIEFWTSAYAGAINTTGTTTTYTSASDYRLKEDVQPISAALAKVSALKPCTYRWKVDGSEGQGFIAHELAEVCPVAVIGEKDEINEDGSIKPQSIDPSKLVALLTAAIQELSAKNEALEARLAALESK